LFDWKLKRETVIGMSLILMTPESPLDEQSNVVPDKEHPRREYGHDDS
jgi:hypothetical protein